MLLWVVSPQMLWLKGSHRAVCKDATNWIELKLLLTISKVYPASIYIHTHSPAHSVVAPPSSCSLTHRASTAVNCWLCECHLKDTMLLFHYQPALRKQAENDSPVYTSFNPVGFSRSQLYSIGNKTKKIHRKIPSSSYSFISDLGRLCQVWIEFHRDLPQE